LTKFLIYCSKRGENFSPPLSQNLFKSHILKQNSSQDGTINIFKANFNRNHCSKDGKLQ
jgi:hypothetical protein